MIANVYVDGFNLYYGCLKGTPHKWLDLAALAERLLPKDEIHCIRYFTAMGVDRPDQPGRAQRQATYLRALETIPELSIHLGHFLTSRVRMPLVSPPAGGPRTVEVLKTEEKGSDVNLATHLLLDAFRGDFEVAVVITNDSDLREPINIVRHEFGIPVGVVNPHPRRKRSRALQGTFFRQIPRTTPSSCQFPRILKDSRGAFCKPETW